MGASSLPQEVSCRDSIFCQVPETAGTITDFWMTQSLITAMVEKGVSISGATGDSTSGDGKSIDVASFKSVMISRVP